MTDDRPDDTLLPEGIVAQRYGVARRSLRRWDAEDIGFPPPLLIRGRRYRRLGDLREWEIQRARPEARRAHTAAWRKAHGRETAEAT